VLAAAVDVSTSVVARGALERRGPTTFRAAFSSGCSSSVDFRHSCDGLARNEPAHIRSPARPPSAGGPAICPDQRLRHAESDRGVFASLRESRPNPGSLEVSSSDSARGGLLAPLRTSRW
jgi:hypothetical protein